jgi:apolipoprotein N-acyltransferase
MAESPIPPLHKGWAFLMMLGAAACFHAAYSTRLSFFIFGYVICLVQLARLRPMRVAFYAGLLTGLICFGPQLEFFWRIFGPAALGLWTILALWIALFVALTHASFARLGATRSILLMPFLWTGLEYFRSELYYLRFTWLNVGYALSYSWINPSLHTIGVYGIGFIAALFAACIAANKLRHAVVISIAALSLFAWAALAASPTPKPSLQVAGVQMEFPTPNEVLSNLDKAVAQCPDAQLLVLSEYTFNGPVPDPIKQWCRTRQRYLIAGGKDPLPGNAYYNTAFVIGPGGDIVFKQAKSVPIQFFSDGLPAAEQKVWDSPWGKIGICICYDLSYSRVIDPLIRLGARALIVPTMDVEEWGLNEHALHERVAPVRAAEYGVPIFRVASSGISQLVASDGRELSKAPFGARGAIISGGMAITDGAPHLPLDRALAPLSVAVTAGFMGWLVLDAFRRRHRKVTAQPGRLHRPTP